MQALEEIDITTFMDYLQRVIQQITLYRIAFLMDYSVQKYLLCNILL